MQQRPTKDRQICRNGGDHHFPLKGALMNIRFSPVGWRMTIFVVLMLASACATGCGPNHSYITKENVELSGQFRRGEATYASLLIGTPTWPFDKNLALYGDLTVALSQDNEVTLSELNVAALKQQAINIKRLDDVGYTTPWPKGSEKIKVRERLYFIVQDGRILHLYANTVGSRPGEEPPTFGHRTVEKLYPMPFVYQDVLDLFGEPDEVRDVWHQ